MDLRLQTSRTCKSSLSDENENTLTLSVVAKFKARKELESGEEDWQMDGDRMYGRKLQVLDVDLMLVNRHLQQVATIWT